MDQKPDAHEQLKAEILKDVEEKIAAQHEDGEPSASSSEQTADDGSQALEAEIREQAEAKRQQAQQKADGNDKPPPVSKPADKDGASPADNDAESGDRGDDEAADKGTAKDRKQEAGGGGAGVKRSAGKGARRAGKGAAPDAARGKKKSGVSAKVAKQLQSATGNKKHAARLLEEKQVIDSHFRKWQMVMYVMISMGTIAAAVVIFQVARNRDNSAPAEPVTRNLPPPTVVQPAPPPDDRDPAMEPSPALRALMDEAKELVAMGKFKESIKLFEDHIHDAPSEKPLCERAMDQLIAERDHLDRGSPRWRKVHKQARELIAPASDTRDVKAIVRALTLVRTFNERPGKDRDRAEELLRKLDRIHFKMTGITAPDSPRGSGPGAAVPPEPGDGGAVDGRELLPPRGIEDDWDAGE